MQAMNPLFRVLVASLLSLVLLIQNAVAVIPLDRANPGPSDVERIAQMKRMFEFWREVDFSLDRTELDPVGLGKRLATPEAAFDWVKKNTRIIPYQGVLRGSKGVLSDRQGNSLDRSLLLAEMLKAQGHEVALRRGHIRDSAIIDELLQDWEQPFDAWHAMSLHSTAERLEATAISMLGQLDLDHSQEDWEASTRAEKEYWEAITRDLQSKLQAAVENLPIKPELQREVFRRALKDHWWVEWKSDETQQWIALDVAEVMPARQAGVESYSGHLAINSIDDGLFHTVKLEFVVQIQTPDGKERHVLLDRRLRPKDLHTPLVSMTMSPLGASAGDALGAQLNEVASLPRMIDAYESVEAWVPVIVVDGQAYLGMGVTKNGEVIENLAGHTPGQRLEEGTSALGRLSVRGLAPETQTRKQWTGASIELTQSSPGLDDRTFSRVLFDVEDPGWFEPFQKVSAASIEYAKFQAYARESHFFLQTHDFSPLDVLADFLDTMLGHEDLLFNSAINPEFDPLDARDELQRKAPQVLTDFAFSRLALTDQRQVHSINQIGMVGFYSSMTPLSGKELQLRSTLDVINLPTASRSRTPEIETGISDSVNEWRVLGHSGNSVLSGASELSKHSALDIDGLVIRSESEWNAYVGDSEFSMPIGYRQALERGNVVLAFPVEHHSESFPVGPYWWELDTATGNVLVRDLYGQGSASQVLSLTGLQFVIGLSDAVTYGITGALISFLFFNFGYMHCMATTMNGPCCLAVGVGLGAFGAGNGFLVGAAFGTVAGFVAGVAFDVVLSPLIPLVPQCNSRIPDRGY